MWENLGWKLVDEKMKSKGEGWVKLNYLLLSSLGRKPNMEAIAVGYALSMLRESRQRLQRISSFQRYGESARAWNGRRIVWIWQLSFSWWNKAQRCEEKPRVKVVSGKNVITGVNERYEEMKENTTSNQQPWEMWQRSQLPRRKEIDLIHVWRVQAMAT